MYPQAVSANQRIDRLSAAANRGLRDAERRHSVSSRHEFGVIDGEHAGDVLGALVVIVFFALEGRGVREKLRDDLGLDVLDNGVCEVDRLAALDPVRFTGFAPLLFLGALSLLGGLLLCPFERGFGLGNALLWRELFT
jgi:hypothetical protein